MTQAVRDDVRPQVAPDAHARRALKILGAALLLAAGFFAPILIPGERPIPIRSTQNIEGPAAQIAPAKKAAEPAAAVGEEAAKASDEPARSSGPIRSLAFEPSSPVAGQSTLLEVELAEADPKASLIVAAWMKRPYPSGTVAGLTEVSVRLEGPIHRAYRPVSFPQPGEWQVFATLFSDAGIFTAGQTVTVSAPESTLAGAMLPAAPDGPVLYLLGSRYGTGNALQQLDARTGELLGQALLPGQLDFVVPAAGGELFLLHCPTPGCQGGRLASLDPTTGQAESLAAIQGRTRLLGATWDGSRIFLLHANPDRSRDSLLRTYLVEEDRWLQLPIVCANTQGFAASADGRTAFVSCFPRYEGQRFQIFRADLDSGAVVEFPAPAGQGAWSTILLLHPDGRRLFLVDGWEHEVAELDAVSGELLRTASYAPTAGLLDRLLHWLAPAALAKPYHGGPAPALLSPDGSRLYVAGAGHDGSWGLHVMETSNLSLTAHLQPDQPFDALSLSPDGRLLLAAAAGEVQVFDAYDLEEVARFPQDGKSRATRLAYAVPSSWAVLPADPVIFSAIDNLAYALDLRDGELKALGRASSQVVSLPGRPPLVTAEPRYHQGELRIALFDASTAFSVAALSIPADQPPRDRLFAVQADGDRIFLLSLLSRSAQWHAALHAFDASSFERLWSLPLAEGSGLARKPTLLLSGDGGQAYVLFHEQPNAGVSEETLVVVDLSERRPMARLKLGRANGCDGRWEAAGQRLVHVCDRMDPSGSVPVLVVDAPSGEVTTHEVQLDPQGLPLDYLQEGAFGHALHGDRLYLASASEPRLVVLDLSSGRQRSVTLTPPRSLLHRLLDWLVPTAEAKPFHNGPAAVLAISPDGNTLYLARWAFDAQQRAQSWAPAGWRGEGVWVIDAETLAVRDHWLQDAEVWSLALGADGSRLYATDPVTRELWIVDASTGEPLGQRARVPTYATLLWTP